MKKIIFLLILLMFSLSVNAQVYKFVSKKNNLTDNNLKVTTFNQTCYLTFDFDKKIITVKIYKPASQDYDVFNFKMIKAEYRNSPFLGNVYLIYVNANLPSLKGIETFKFNPNYPFIWVDGPGGTITYAVEKI